MLISENTIFGLRRSMDPVFGIGLMEHELRSEFFREEHLPYVRGVALHIGLSIRAFLARYDPSALTHLEVDMVRAPHVEAWENGRELHPALIIRELDAAEKC